jgi:hypothetical protein
VLGSDDVSYVGGSASFADKNVGTGKNVTATGLSLSGADAGNYTVNTTAGTTADITPATLIVTADNKFKMFGSTNPPLTATITGFVDGGTDGSFSGNPSLSTTVTNTTPVGSYLIAVSLGTLSDPNYTFSLVPGTFRVMPPPNMPPVLPNQVNRALTDLTTLTVVNTGSDSNTPAQHLSYQLLNPPAGMQVSANGVITWTPTLAQSPSTNIVTTIVTDDGIPPLSATNSFSVIVSGPYDGINLADPVQALEDLDGDGLSNLIEYGLGTDPRNPADSQAAMATSIVSNGANQYVSLRFKRRTQDGGIAIQYLPEVSGDGHTWYSDSAHVLEVSASPLNAQFDWVVVQDQTPTSNAAPRFIRLRIVEN